MKPYMKATIGSLMSMLACGPLISTAQNENAVWLFNMTTGVDFMTNPPTILHGYSGYGGTTAAISDENGQLVFFSDQTDAWNANNQLLLNGDNLTDGYSNPVQSSMILPWPGHPGQYYKIQPRMSHPLYYPDSRALYHRIDMNAGVGEVIELNVPLADSAGVYHTAVLDSDGTGIWVILHHLNQPRFMAYHLGVTGLSTAPVISEAGPPIDPWVFEGIGILRPSPLGERLYMSKCYQNCADFTSLHQMDFNRATGQITNFSTFDGPVPGSMGLEISPSGQFLYTTAYICDSSVTSRLWQYDVSSGDPAIIQASKTLVYEAPRPPGPCQGIQGNLALGIDGRIYCAVSNAQYLGVINEPDLPAPACNYVHQGLYMDGDTTWLWLPNQMRQYPDASTGMLAPEPSSARLHIRPDPAGDGCWITIPDATITSLALIDGTGRAVRQLPTSQQREVRLDRGGLGSSMYQVIARNDAGHVLAVGRVVFE